MDDLGLIVGDIHDVACSVGDGVSGSNGGSGMHIHTFSKAYVIIFQNYDIRPGV